MGSEIACRLNQRGFQQSVRKGTPLRTKAGGSCGRSTRVARRIPHRKVAYLQITVGHEDHHRISRMVGRNWIYPRSGPPGIHFVSIASACPRLWVAQMLFRIYNWNVYPGGSYAGFQMG